MGDRGGSSPFIRTKGYRQAVRHKTLTLARGSSNLPTPANARQYDLSLRLHRIIYANFFLWPIASRRHITIALIILLNAKFHY